MSGDPEIVREVTDVSVSYLESQPPFLVVQAKGNVSTGGWSNPTLTRLVYVMPPADGIQEYEFRATPPSGIATEVISPVSASDRWHGPADWVRGVRVKAATNSIEEAAMMAGD